jgi:hypothetical protein
MKLFFPSTEMNRGTIERRMIKIMNENVKTKESITEKFNTIVDACRAVGIKKVWLTFSGSNGRAFMNDVMCDNEETGTWAALEDMITFWAWDLIHSTGVDIWKDDGGRGDIDIDVELGDYAYRVYQFYTSENLMAAKKMGTALSAVSDHAK